MTSPTLTLALTLGLQASPALPGQGATPRPVDIASFDGAVLRATYYGAARPGPAVVIFRNCDGDRTRLDPFARRLSARGVHVVTWDYRSGSATGLDWRGTRLRDSEAVFAWLGNQAGVDSQRLVAIGGSCGVSLALDFGALHVGVLKGLVLLSGPSGSQQRAFVARTPGLAIFGAASRAEGPAVPYIDSVVTLSSNPASLLLTPADGGHGTEMLSHSPEFEASVLTWIVARLGITE